MSVLDNSYTSERDSPIRIQSHSLCQDLQQLGAKSQIEYISASKPEIQSQQNDNSFLSPNQNNKLQHQPSLDLENNTLSKIKIKQLQQNQQEFPNQNKDEDDSNSSPKTITLIQENIECQHLSMEISSKISQYSIQVDNQSYATFLSIRDTNYNSLIKNFQLLFENVTNLFGQRIKKISQTYLNFIKLKYQQQKSFHSTKFGYTYNNRQCIIYANSKTITQQIRNKMQTQITKRTQYIKILQEILTKLQKHFQTVFAIMQNKTQKIKEIHIKLIDIIKQMSDLMIPQIRKKNKNIIDKQIYSSTFLRTKYLMSKQKSYLNLIGIYLQKVLNFISFVCLDIEPNTCLIVKQAMLGYIQGWLIFKPENKHIFQKQVNILQNTNCLNTNYQQVSKLLQLCIPYSICPDNIHQPTQNSQKKLKKVIQSLISQSQSLVYIPVIQLQPKDYVYHSKNRANVKWIKIDHNKKISKQSIQQSQTHVIITHEGQLILQLIDSNKNSQEKMAILKLKNIKMSRKNNIIYLIDRGKGMIGYLMSSNQLIGTLRFQNYEGSGQNLEKVIQDFILNIKNVLEFQKQNKEKIRNK